MTQRETQNEYKMYQIDPKKDLVSMWQFVTPWLCSCESDNDHVTNNPFDMFVSKWSSVRYFKLKKKSFKNNPLLDSLENGGLIGTRALVPSLFDVPFLWCSISKKIEMTWTRKFVFSSRKFVFFVFTILDDPYQIMFIDPEFWF